MRASARLLWPRPACRCLVVVTPLPRPCLVDETFSDPYRIVKIVPDKYRNVNVYTAAVPLSSCPCAWLPLCVST